MKNSLKSLILLACLLSACQSPDVTFLDAICIENISTIDPEDGLKENQTVIIKDGKIFKIIDSDKLQLSKTNQIIDGTGKFLIPGLWDAHVHFAYIEELAPSMFDLFLAFGITSVRDTGGEIGFVKEWKEKSSANPHKAPRVMIAGPLLDGIPNVYDGSNPSRPPLSVGLSTMEAVVQQVNQLDSQGVDLLKAYEMLSPDQFAMVAKMGKEKGLKVTGHVPLSMDVISASNAGLNSMEHLRNLELSCASNADELLEQRIQLLMTGKKDPGGILRSRVHQAQRQNAIENYDEQKANKVLKVLSKNQTWQIPTIVLNTNFTERYYSQTDWLEAYKHLPDSIEQQWKSNMEIVLQREISDFDRQYTNWKFNMVEKIHEADIDIMAGTDCPIFFLVPGHSLHQELIALEKSGLAPLEVLKTATLNPAKYFGLQDELGSIKENMLADLIILNANPLEAIKNTQNIKAVFKQGAYYDRTQLDQMLE